MGVSVGELGAENEILAKGTEAAEQAEPEAEAAEQAEPAGDEEEAE